MSTVTVYPDDFENVVRSYAKGISAYDLQKKLTEHYGYEIITIPHLRAYKKNHHIQSGYDSKYKKGNVPMNKGTHPKTKGRMAETQFKKGDIPHNQAPVGTKVFDVGKGGYWKEKVAQPNKWEFCHILVLKEHGIEVPKGYMVKFLDGNKDNYDISNLKIISRAVNIECNKKGLYADDKQITEAGINIAKINIAIREKRNKKVSKN